MTAHGPKVRLLALVLLVGGLAGCHAVDFYQPVMQQPVPPPLEPPRELNMTSLPAYRVEPPDLLYVEMLKLVPRPPYRIDTYDVLEIRVLGAMPGQPIDGFFIVEVEGIVTLGPAYGTIRVAGMTIEEATRAITKRLQGTLSNPDVSVKLGKAAGTAPVSGEYIVGPDGTINLKEYGTLYVAGKTLNEIRLDLQKHLEQYFDSPQASVEVRQYNSKVFYVITQGQGAGQGDNIRRVPITGNETVLDALTVANGLSPVSSAKIWIARPAPGGFGCEQILPVDYGAIAQGGQAATNYQILPGDRVFIAEDGMLAFNNYLAKVTAPIEKLLGLTGLATTTTRSAQTLGRSYNLNRSGN